MQRSEKIWQELAEKNLVEGEAPQLEIESTWFMKSLASMSGWLGALFFILAFGASIFGILGINSYNSPLILTIIGIGLILFVYKLFQEKQSDFLEHFLLALSMTGQVLIIFSMANILNSYAQTLFLFVAIFQAFLMWVMPNYTHRVLSSFFMAMALSSFFYEVHLFSFYLSILTFVVAWLFLNEFYFNDLKKMQSIAYGQLSALVWLKTLTISSYTMLNAFGSFDGNSPMQFFASFTEFLTTLTLGYVVWKILEQKRKLDDKKVLLFSLMSVLLLGLISLSVTGLVTGITLLVIGFSTSHRLLIGLGVITSLFFISNYYYYMGETLLDKAVVLALVGLSLLSFRWAVKQFLFKEGSNV